MRPVTFVLIVAVVIVVVGGVALAVWPIYPVVTATFEIKAPTETVTFLSVKMERVGVIAVAGLSEGTVVFSPIKPDNDGYKVLVSVEVTQTDPAGSASITTPWVSVVTGQSSLSFIERLDAPISRIHIRLRVIFSGNELVSAETDFHLRIGIPSTYITVSEFSLWASNSTFPPSIHSY